MKDGYAPSGSEWIYYREAGSGNPVIFIHAGVADSRMWIGQLEAVPDGFWFVAYDQRGFGNSVVGSSSFQAHSDVLAILDNLSIDSAVLVGCSIGGGIALDVAIEAPDRVRALVLVGADSPGFEAEDPFESPQWPEAVREFKAGNFERGAELDAEMWLAGHDRDLGAVDTEIVQLFKEMDLTALRHETRRDELQEPGPDRALGVRGVEKPTLVIVGEHDMPDLQEHAHHLSSRLSRHPAAVIDDAAHLPSLERPQAFNDVLHGFLRSLT